MKIGIMGAIPEEIALLRGAITGATTVSVGRRDFICGTLNDHEVVLVFSRCGKVSASSTATTLIERFGVGLIIFTGVAGALDRTLNVGDLVVGSRLVQHDVDASAIAGFKRFEIPYLGVQFFDAPPDLVARAQAAAAAYVSEDMPAEIPAPVLREFGITKPRVIAGLIASGDQFIASNTVADELRAALPGVQCVEMEGAAVAQVAYEHDLPCIVLRTISDRADHSAHVDFPAFATRIASHFTCGCVVRLLRTLREQEA